MSSENNVKAAQLTFGTGGTSTFVAAMTTNTTVPYPLPRSDYTVQLTQYSTGTSIAAATVIWQGSNDNLAYASISSATTLPATNAGTAGTITYQAADIRVSGIRHAFGRAIVGSTGTGNAAVTIGS